MTNFRRVSRNTKIRTDGPVMCFYVKDIEYLVLRTGFAKWIYLTAQTKTPRKLALPWGRTHTLLETLQIRSTPLSPISHLHTASAFCLIDNCYRSSYSNNVCFRR